MLKVGFYQPMLFGDVHSRIRMCQKCQVFAKRQKLSPLPLILVHMEEPFRHQGLDFIGKINPPCNDQHKWIVISTEYFTKWVEAIPAKNATNSMVIKFMLENILSHFGCPFKIIIDNAQVFKFAKFTSFFHKYNITIGHSTTYYPQGNGLAESLNKSMVRILKKTIAETQRNWDSQLNFALWANQVMPKISTRKSLFELVYGKVVVIPIQLKMRVTRLLQEVEEEPSALTRRINQLVELQENREQVDPKLSNYQQNMKSMFENKAKDIPLQPGDLVLMWDVRQRKTWKIQSTMAWPLQDCKREREQQIYA